MMLSIAPFCIARGLLEDDKEWIQCLEEASALQTGSQLYSHFVTILISASPTRPKDLWDHFVSTSVTTCTTNCCRKGFLTLQRSKFMTMVST
jgi:hypothetical protein